jgi:hypothetical protein
MNIYVWSIRRLHLSEKEHVSPKEMDGCTRNLIWGSDKRWHIELNKFSHFWCKVFTSTLPNIFMVCCCGTELLHEAVTAS